MSSKPLSHAYDLAIVGGGIIGLATGREILRRQPRLRLVVLEKEASLVSHQSGHNSGVIHSGIYYAPGSLKARACVAGHQAMIEFARERGIPFNLCGKVIVALDEREIPRLENLYQRGLSNGVQGLELIGPDRLKELEPYAAGLRAIYSPNTGVIDYPKVAQVYAEDIQKSGGEIVTQCLVQAVRAGDPSILQLKGASGESEIEARFVITCGGLHSDRLARSTGSPNEARIIPFRGDYYRLRAEKRHMVKALIYPVPDPRVPFLGVHFTRLLDDEVWAGPNAVLAFAREGYKRTDVNLVDMWDVLSYPGFWRMGATYWRMGLQELYRDYVKSAYVRALQRYMPALQHEDLEPGPSGVRAQALATDGSLIDDFLVGHQGNVVHVQNAPSPAATSSLVIARMIVDEAQRWFNITA